MKAFKNVRAYIDGKVRTADIAFDGKIAGIDSGTDGAEAVRLPDGAIVTAGFIDTHVHGAGGADAMDGTTAALDVISKNARARGHDGVFGYYNDCAARANFVGVARGRGV